MITINTIKGLVKVESWNDIEDRLGFEKNLNPKDHELQSIIGRYVFAEKIACGLSNCHKPHAKGYIVSTKNGRETNIGKDCGKTYFGVDFEVLTKQFDRDVTEAENRDFLWSFSFQLDELEVRIENLRRSERGADWIHKHSQALINPNIRCPAEVVRRMSAMVKTKSNVVFSQRKATEKEIEDLETIQRRKLPRPYYVEEPIAEILGIEALYPENDLRNLLVLELEENIKVFKTKSIDSFTYEQLAHWKKWASSVELLLDTAASSIGLGRTLLTRSNLESMLKILDNPKDRALFRAFLESL